MKIILNLIIFFMASHVFCQNSHKSLELFNNGKYSEAIPEFERDLPELIKVWGDKDTIWVIQFYGLLADCYVQTGKKELAIKNYEKGIEIGNYYKNFNNEAHFYNVFNYLHFLKINNLILEKEKLIIDVLNKNWEIISLDKRKNLLVLLDEINQNFTLSFRSELDIYIKESMGGILKTYSEYFRLDSIFKFQFYTKYDYENALLTAEKLIGISKSEFGINSINYYSDNQSYASCYFELKEYDKCMHLLLGITENINNCYECTTEDYVSSLVMMSLVCEEQKNYQDVIKYSEMIKSIYESDSTIYHINKYYALKRIGKAYMSLNSYSNAEKYYSDAFSYTKRFNDYNNMYNTMTSLGITYLRQNLFSKAYLAFMESKDFYEKEGNMNIDEYCAIISHFSELYINLNKSLEGIETILNIYKKNDSEVNSNQKILKTCANVLGKIYLEVEDYLDAVKYFELSLKYSSDTLSLNYANIIINLGTSYARISKYEIAEKHLIKGLELTKNNKETLPNDLATAHNNLGFLYTEMNLFKNAEQHLNESMKITESQIGKDNIEYGARLNNLAEIYVKLNKFELANEYYINSIKNAIDLKGYQSINYLTFANNYALFLHHRGQFASAMKLFNELMEISENIKDKYPKTDELIYFNAGTLLVTIGSYETALNLFLQSEKYHKENFLANTKSYATLLSSVAVCYLNLKNKNNALEYAWSSLEINNSLFGQKSLESIISLKLLSNIYLEFNDFDKAILIIEKAYNIYKNSNIEMEIGAEIGLILDYAWVNINIENYSKVTIAIDSLILKLNKFVEIHLNYQSEKELEELMIYLDNNYDMIRNIVYRLSLNNIDSSSHFFYNLELFKKQLIISTLLDRVKLGAKNPCTVSKDFSGIQRNLKPNQVSLEFSSFRYFNSNTWSDSIFYVALLLRPYDTIPKIIKLCEQNQLDSIFVRINEKESNHINNIYNNTRLYELIWKPIERYVNLGDDIYFAPSGTLHQISIGAIMQSDSTYLSDNYTFKQIGSTSILSSECIINKPLKDIVIFGGINYDASDEQIASLSKDIILDDIIVSRSLYTQDSTRGGKWTFLHGTLDEALSIDKIAKSNNIKSQVYSGSTAIEERFKSISGEKSKSIVHIATHGFFFPDPRKEKMKTKMMSFHFDNKHTLEENPMNRSGLLLTGSNRAWIGEEFNTDHEDGILTAYEVSKMSLFNTELVVLSACETGLGDIKGSEGVYGLQRAFKQAGTRYLMMSLWKVPDQATQEFMTTFYTELFTNKLSIRTSFNKAQNYIKAKYRNEPYKWAGFVLME